MGNAGLFLSAGESEVWGSPTGVGGSPTTWLCSRWACRVQWSLSPPSHLHRVGGSGKEGRSSKAPELSVKELKMLSFPPSLPALSIGSDCHQRAFWGRGARTGVLRSPGRFRGSVRSKNLWSKTRSCPPGSPPRGLAPLSLAPPQALPESCIHQLLLPESQLTRP